MEENEIAALIVGMILGLITMLLIWLLPHNSAENKYESQNNVYDCHYIYIPNEPNE